MESRRKPLWIAVVAVYGASLLALVLRNGTVLNYHEARYALGAKEMLARGQWLIPTLLGAPRLEKPPLTYWAIATSMAVSGSTSESAVRLPSALSSLLAALMIGWLAARRLGDRAALLAALIQLTCVYALIEAQLADPDMLLAVAVTAAMTAFAATELDGAAAHPDRRRLSGLVFYAAAGIGFLAKGPIALALIFPACLAFVLSQGRLGGLGFFWNPTGILMLTALVLFWPVATHIAEPAALGHWMRENFGRFRGELGHEPLLFYFYTFPWLILPWMPFAVYGAVGIWRRGDTKAPLWRFLGLWFAIGIALLSLSAGKHERYLTPVLPPLSLFAAEGILLFLRDRPKLRFATPILFAGIWMIVVLVQRFVIVGYDSYYRGQAELARRIDRQMPPGEPLYLLSIPHNAMIQLAYYLSTPLVPVDDVASFRSRLGDETVRIVHLTGPALLSLPLTDLGAPIALDRCRTLRGAKNEEERLTFFKLALR